MDHGHAAAPGREAGRLMSAGSVALPTRRPRNGVIRNISYLFGGQLATWVLAALWTVVVPRQIGPTGMGQLVTVWSGIGILTIVVGLGTRVLVVTEIAREPASAGRKVAAATIGRLVLFVPGAGLMAIYLHFAHFDHQQVVLLIVATAATPFVLASEVFNAAFQGLERMQYIALLDIIYKTVTMVGGIVLVLLGFRVLGLILLGASAGAVVFAISIFWARHHFDLVWLVEPVEVWRVAVKSLPFWATTMISTIYLWVDSVMLALLATAAEVGYYGVPTKIFATLLFIPVIISTATLARLSATFSDSHDSFRRVLTPIVESTLVISLPITAGTIAIAGPAIALLYGPAYGQSVPVLEILALCIPATYLNIVVNQSLVASGRQIVWTKVMAASVIANVLLNLFAIPAARGAWHDGALGAAWSLLATEVLMAGTGMYLVRRSLDMAAAGRVSRTALAALAMGLAVHAAAPLGVLVQVPLGALLFAGLAALLRLARPEELAVGRGYAARLRLRLRFAGLRGR